MNDMMLKRMKRRHTTAQAIAFCKTLRARRPEIVFGADFIAGFPTETDAMFEATLRHVEDCGLTYLHVFPFSARDGTPAARMPQVPGEMVKRRAARLRKAGEAALSDHLRTLTGATLEVLVEQNGLARAPSFAPVRLAVTATPGSILRARILHTDERFAYAEAA